jgi:hypothetical protein
MRFDPGLARLAGSAKVRGHRIYEEHGFSLPGDVVGGLLLGLAAGRAGGGANEGV